MSEEKSPIEAPSADELIPRVRRFVEVFNETDLVRLRITDDNENFIELRRSMPLGSRAHAEHLGSNGALAAEQVLRPVDVIKSDLVGIAYLSKPALSEGVQVEGDRELGYVEALGIRNPVRSLGPGRLVGVLITEGQPVEYGQPMFEIERV